MKEVTKYIANDGKEFDNKEDCLLYEQSIIGLNEAIKTIENYCMSRSCGICKFYEDGVCGLQYYSPSDYSALL